MMRRAAIPILVLAIAACGNGRPAAGATSSTPATTTVATTTPPTLSTTLDEVAGAEARLEETRRLVEAAGVSCTDWRVLANPPNAIVRASCTSRITLSIHEDAAQVQAAVEASEVTVGYVGAKAAHVVGDDWSVDCAEQEGFYDYLLACEAIHQALGGELLVPPED